MSRKTPLYESHLRAGARMVDFAGWSMPLHYGSQVEEHHAVRRRCGMFDVSHMSVAELEGPSARDALRGILANDVAKVREPGGALYSCMLNDHGGVVDDLIVYRMDEGWWRVVSNAATREKDLGWLRAHAMHHRMTIRPREDLVMIAVQGSEARERVHGLLPPDLAERARGLRRFRSLRAGQWHIARTGYTGEDGYELIVPAAEAPALWEKLVAAGVRPCGLGARDSLRLEAGMNLYGSDMDETVSPLESGLGWTVAWEPPERSFVGRPELERLRAEPSLRRFVGLVLREGGVMRSHQRIVVPGVGTGAITSGGFSPTLGVSIALGRVPAATGEQCHVQIRGREVPVWVVRPPFVREGRSCIEGLVAKAV